MKPIITYIKLAFLILVASLLSISSPNTARASGTITLAWNWQSDFYNPTDECVFEIWHSFDLSTGLAGFTPCATVAASPAVLSSLAPQEFFIVRTLNIVTGIRSDWSGKYQ